MAKQQKVTCAKCGGSHVTGSAVCSMSPEYARLVEKANRERAERNKNS